MVRSRPMMKPPPVTASRELLDRFGQPVDPADLVLYTPPVPVIYKVIDVRPDLHPGGQPGRVIVTLQADVHLPLPAGTPIGALHRVGFLGQNGPVIGSATRGPIGADLGQVPQADPPADRQNLDSPLEPATMPQERPGPRPVPKADPGSDRPA